MLIVKVITRLPRVPSSGTRLQPTQHSFASADNNSGVYDREASAAKSQCWNVLFDLKRSQAESFRDAERAERCATLSSKKSMRLKKTIPKKRIR